MSFSVPASADCASEHCITCADDGTPMVVIRVDAVRKLALCEDEEGRHSTVEMALVSSVGVGDRVLVHAAVAIAPLPAGERGAAPAQAGAVEGSS